VTDLLDYARDPTLERQEYRLGEVVGPAVDAYADKARAKGITLVARGVDADLPVHADGQRLRRVFVNVISNAFEAAEHRSDGRVEVTLSRRGNDAVVDVTDNGEGIAPEARARILQPFFTTKPAGTGLGLVIVKKIMDQHGGRIEIDTTPGIGTTVRLVIPMRR
jgi:signal transduction histidine kinase